MNEQPYKVEHLQKYKGLLTSLEPQNGRFRMELKVEDNPVIKERWAEKNESTIELEFRYNGGPSVMFFHNRFTCPNYLERVDCDECERMQKMYDVFAENLYHLQFGDTFRIEAALINNDQSVLPAEIHSFENYQPLLAACTNRRLRLNDTPEGINKRYEREQQRLQEALEAEVKRREDEEKRKEEADKAKRKEKWDRLEQWLAKYPNTLKIGVTILGATVLNQIDHIFKGLKFLFKLIFPN